MSGHDKAPVKAPMDAALRKACIKETLQQSEAPVSASAFARAMGVSRQVIVGDIALLRAAGEEIYSTPRGYVWAAAEERGKVYTLACIHTPAGTEEELNTIVYYGGEVLDVVVSHPLYGQISAPLDIKTHYDVQQFVEAVAGKEAALLSDLTGGLHLHRIRCAGEQTFGRIREALDARGMIYHGEA